MLQKIKDRSVAFYSNHQNKQFIRLILIGLLIRIILMPFFGHIDVLSEARRVFYWSENNIFFDNISRNTTMFFEVSFFKIFNFLLPNNHTMLFHADMANTTASVPSSFEFVSHYDIFRTLFVLKIPFLFFDLLTTVILYNYFNDKNKGLRSCKMWLFNPVTLFAFYIFGRFEAIPIFFITAAIFALKKDKVILAAILLGMCLNGREMMILYFPIFLVAVLFSSENNFDLKRRVAAALIIVAFTAITLQIFSVLGINSADAVGNEGVVLLKESRISHLFAFSLHRIMFLPLVYTLIIIWTWTSNVEAYKKLLLGGALAMMSFFAFSSHTAHFTSWMVVFPVIFYGYDRTILKPFIAFCLAWIGYWAFLTDLGVFTLWLAAPFSLHFTSIPNIPAICNHISANWGIFDLGMMISLFKTFFVASLIYLAAIMIKVIARSDEKTTS